MNTKYIATLAAMLAVPAPGVSCDGQNYSTPEGVLKGEVKLMKDFAEAAKACDKDNIAGLESTIKELTATQNQISKWLLEPMPPEQWEAMQKLCTGGQYDKLNEAITGLDEAKKDLTEKLGPEGVETLNPVLDEFEKSLEPFVGLLISFSFP